MDKVFMIGIAGTGMSKLALMLSDLGYEVFGTDVQHNFVVDSLIERGIEVVSSDFVLDKSFNLVVYSSAVPLTDPHLIEARQLGIKTEKRGETLARISRDFRSIVIAGTHGKTTTATMVGASLRRSFKTDLYVGAETHFYDDFSKDAEYFVIESDESDGTFLLFNPEILILTNVDRDHLNLYGGNFSELKTAFAKLLGQSSKRVVSMDDPVASSLSSSFSDTFFYSVSNHSANAFAKNIRFANEGVYFDAFILGGYAKNVFLPALGLKNISNALAAMLVSLLLGESIDKSVEGLAQLHMPSRRLEKKGEVSSIIVFDDHADHPTEVEATLDAIKKHFPMRRIIAIFQPHRYSRMSLLREEVGRPFHLADVVLVTDIFPAFEPPIEGISGESVYNWIKNRNIDKEIFYVKDKNDIAKTVGNVARRSDIVVTLGPGDIGSFSASILDILKEKI